MSELPPPPPPPPNYGPPPGYVPYEQSQPAGGFCSPIATLTKWLVGLLVVGIGASVVSIIVQIALRNSAADFIDNPTRVDFDSKVAPYLAVAAFAAFAGIAQIVILIIWTFRIARNAQVLGRFDQKFRPGITTAVNLLGSCTLGILNFFMWRELWRASDPDALPGDPTWRERAVSPLIALHLGLNLAGIAISATAGASRLLGQFDSSSSNDDLAKQLNEQLPSIVIGGLFTLAASVVFLMFVRQLAQRHMRAAGER